MRYFKIRRLDVTNGPGVRVTLFVTGCSHKCPGCFNEELQDFEAGKIWDSKSRDEIIENLQNPMVVGLNLLGGEPLEQTMDTSLRDLLREVRAMDKSIWLWTGFIFEECLEDEDKMDIIKECDVIIDGPFIKAKRNIKLKYRGSENQRVIDVEKSLKENKTIIHDIK